MIPCLYDYKVGLCSNLCRILDPVCDKNVKFFESVTLFMSQMSKNPTWKGGMSRIAFIWDSPPPQGLILYKIKHTYLIFHRN